MGLFQEAVNQQAFAKISLYGGQGSGKTYTATKIAIGICQRLKSKGPIAFFDTEGSGSDFAKKLTDAAGIDMIVVKSQAFTDAVAAFEDAQTAGATVLIFDSVSHLWKELFQAAMRRKNRDRLSMPDWGKVNQEWDTKFARKFVNFPIHTITCGRVGKVYEEGVDENGRKTLIVVGTKMKAQGEFGYEASLLVEMERVRTGNGSSGAFTNRATVLKDRADEINGLSFDKPTFDDFAPHFDYLNIGGEHVGVDTTRNSEELFDKDGELPGPAYRTQCDIVYEEIKGLFDEQWPGATTDAKKAKMAVFVKIFATRSETGAKRKSLNELRGCHFALVCLINEERLETGGESLPLPDYEEYRPKEEVLNAVTK